MFEIKHSHRKHLFIQETKTVIYDNIPGNSKLVCTHTHTHTLAYD